MTFRELPSGAKFTFAHNREATNLCLKLGPRAYEAVFRDSVFRLTDEELEIEVVRYERPAIRPPHARPEEAAR